MAEFPGPRNILCTDVRDGRVLMVSEGEVYWATLESWRPLRPHASMTEVLRELLQEGATLANSKGFFNLKRFESAEVGGGVCL